MNPILLTAALLFSCAGASDLNLVADQTGILSFLNRRESWERSEILWADVDLAVGKTTRAYFSKLACGRGVCPQYLFLKIRDGRWRLIGALPAQLERTQQVQKGFRVLRTTSFVGEPEAEGLPQTFAFDGERYRAQ
jgi:hypothetical protein